jgi:hypothetical protein
MKHLFIFAPVLSLIACGPTAPTSRPCEQFRARVESGRVTAASSLRSVTWPLPDMAASIVYNIFIDDANAITVTTDAPDAALCHAAATANLNFVGVAATDKNGDWLDSSSSEAGLWYDVPQRVLEGGLPRTHDGVGIDGLVPAFARSALLTAASTIEDRDGYFEVRDAGNKITLFFRVNGGPVGGPHLQTEVGLAKGRSFTYFIGGVADKLYIDVASARW